MERGLRECCKAIHIGHILIQHEATTSEPIVSPRVWREQREAGA
jgi:uracil phosphoribosyltransferase